MVWSVETLLADAAATVAKVVAIKRVDWPPPETSYPDDVWAYLEWGPALIEQASDEVIEHTITITVCRPMRGNLSSATSGEYGAVISAVVAVHREFYKNTIIGGATDGAALASPGTMSKPFLLTYGEVRNVACTLTLQCVTAEEVSATD